MADQAAAAVRDRGTLNLIVVSGASGTGKSTIARELGAALRLPVLSLDPIKEALADVLGLGDEDWSNRVGDAAAEVVFRLAGGHRDPAAAGRPADRGGHYRYPDPVALPLVILAVPEARSGKNRVHPDRATESADPEGSEFCLLSPL